MKKYFVESPHTGRDCLMVLKHFLAAGYLTHFEWGCKAGVHSGWAFIEAESAEEARMVVPSLIRDKARVVELTHFTMEDLEKEEAIHNEKMAQRAARSGGGA